MTHDSCKTWAGKMAAIADVIIEKINSSHPQYIPPVDRPEVLGKIAVGEYFSKIVTEVATACSMEHSRIAQVHLTFGETQKLLGFSEAQLKRFVSEGEIRAMRGPQNTMEFNLAEVRKLMQDEEQHLAKKTADSFYDSPAGEA